MKDTETFKELAKTSAGQDPLVKLCNVEIITAKNGDFQATARNLETLRKYLEKFFKAPSIEETSVFAVEAYVAVGEPRQRWMKLQARINAYQRTLNKKGTGGKNSDGEPDPIPGPVRKRSKDEER